MYLQTIPFNGSFEVNLLNAVTASFNKLMGISFFTRFDGVGTNSPLSLGSLFGIASSNALEFDVSPVSAFLSPTRANDGSDAKLGLQESRDATNGKSFLNHAGF